MNHPEKTNISHFSKMFFFLLKLYCSHQHLSQTADHQHAEVCPDAKQVLPLALKTDINYFLFPLELAIMWITLEDKCLQETLNAQLGGSYFIVYVSQEILINLLQKTCVWSLYLWGIALVCVFARGPGSHLTWGPCDMCLMANLSKKRRRNQTHVWTGICPCPIHY